MRFRTNVYYIHNQTASWYVWRISLSSLERPEEETHNCWKMSHVFHISVWLATDHIFSNHSSSSSSFIKFPSSTLWTLLKLYQLRKFWFGCFQDVSWWPSPLSWKWINYFGGYVASSLEESNNIHGFIKEADLRRGGSVAGNENLLWLL